MRWPEDFSNWPYSDEQRPRPQRPARSSQLSQTKPARQVKPAAEVETGREFGATVPCAACGSQMPRLWFVDRCPACGAIQD